MILAGVFGAALFAFGVAGAISARRPRNVVDRLVLVMAIADVSIGAGLIALALAF